MAILTKSCLFRFGLKDLFPLHTLDMKVVISGLRTHECDSKLAKKMISLLKGDDITSVTRANGLN